MSTVVQTDRTCILIVGQIGRGVSRVWTLDRIYTFILIKIKIGSRATRSTKNISNIRRVKFTFIAWRRAICT